MQEHLLKALDLIPRTTNQIKPVVLWEEEAEGNAFPYLPPLKLHAQSTQAVFTPERGEQ